MNNYTLKNPTAIGREYMVEKFNIAFNMNISYSFFSKTSLMNSKKVTRDGKLLRTKHASQLILIHLS
ncbi:hypothetical protein AtNW77_Chr1g0043781 [Arabidopsis thaliana]